MMRYISGICSDIGNLKKVNQDAALIRQAETDVGRVLLAVLCDGMGGLQKGELASSTAVIRMSDWFENTFPDLLYNNLTPDSLKHSWNTLINRLNDRIRAFGEKQGIHIGTTFTALLLVNGAYYICNVGDSRIYQLTRKIKQLTKDQSYVQREMDMGRMTMEEATRSEKRNVLLQCVGVRKNVTPDFSVGKYEKRSAFLLCSDGFRHVISEDEILNGLYPERLEGEEDIDGKIRRLIEVIKTRREDDNITAALVQVV